MADTSVAEAVRPKAAKADLLFHPYKLGRLLSRTGS
jgi:hypothetical protein